VSAAESPAPLVLVVEDDPALRKLLRTGLPANGWRVEEASDAATGLRTAAEKLPDVIVLDLGLPDFDGVEFVRRLRTWSRIPVLVASARHLERQKIEALDAGADDFVVKPFGFGELLARLRALRRRTLPDAPGDAGVFERGGLRVDFGARRATVDGADARLTPIEWKLLGALARNAGRVVTHRQLLDDVWGPHVGATSQYLRVYMTHLRRKLQSTQAPEALFETVAGVGYRLRDVDPT
jgi:two-component system KDP operon response regulator KdpE